MFFYFWFVSGPKVFNFSSDSGLCYVLLCMKTWGLSSFYEFCFHSNCQRHCEPTLEEKGSWVSAICPKGLCGRRKKQPLEDVHVLISNTCECHLHGKRDFAGVIKSRNLRWWDYPRLSRWASEVTRVLLEIGGPVMLRCWFWRWRKGSQPRDTSSLQKWKQRRGSGFSSRTSRRSVALCILWLQLQLSSVQSLSRVWLFVTPWTTACQASLSTTNSQSLPKLMSIESVMPSSHLILCRPLLLLPSIFPNISA